MLTRPAPGPAPDAPLVSRCPTCGKDCPLRRVGDQWERAAHRARHTQGRRVRHDPCRVRGLDAAPGVEVTVAAWRAAAARVREAARTARARPTLAAMAGAEDAHAAALEARADRLAAAWALALATIASADPPPGGAPGAASGRTPDGATTAPPTPAGETPP